MSDPKSPEYRHFLTPTTIRTGVRADAGHDCAGQFQPPTGGLDGGDAISDRPVAARRRARSPRCSPPSRRRSRSTACRRERPATTTRRHPRWTRRWRRRSKGSSDSTPSVRRSRRRASPRRARPCRIPPPISRPRRCPPGSPSRRREAATPPSRTWRSSTGALDAPDLAQAYSFNPLYSSNDYGAGSTVALLEMSGAGYSSSDINTFATCYGITLGNGPDQAGDGRRRRRHRRRHGRSRARHRDRAFHGPQGGHRGLRRRAFRRPLQRLQPDRQRRHGQDRQRQLDERLRGLRRSVDRRTRRTRSSRRRPRKGSRSSSPRATRARRAATSTERSTRQRATGSDPVAQAVDPSTGTLYIANKSSNTSAWTARGARATRPTSSRRLRCPPDRARAPTPSRSMRRPGRSSWPTTPTAR